METGTDRGSGSSATPTGGAGAASGTGACPGSVKSGGSLAGERVGDRLVLRAVPVGNAEARERVEEGGLRLGERHPVLAAGAAREARLDVAEIQLDDLRVLGHHVGVVEEALHPAKYASTSSTWPALRPVRRR